MVNGINTLQEFSVSSKGLSQENVQNSLEKSKQAVSDNFESNSAIKALAGNSKDPTVMRDSIMLLPVLSVINKFIDGKIAGDEASSLLTKASKVGDKISHVLHLDRLISSETGSKVSNFLKTNTFTKYFTSSYKAVPKSSLAKGSTLADKYRNELINALKEISIPEGYADKFSQETINNLANIQKGAANISSSDLVKTAEEFINQNITNASNGGLLSKGTDISGIKNKLKAANLQIGETGLGKIFAKGFVKSKDAITFGGGIMGLMFTANSIIQAAKAAKEAPKGEKKATFMHVLSEHYIGLLLFQPSINLLYKIGGNKYRGMSVEARNALKELVAKTNADETITKEAIKVAKMQRDLLIKGVDKDKAAELAGKGFKEAKALYNNLKNSGTKVKLWEKPLKFFGKILDTSLDDIKRLKVIKLPKKIPFIGDKIKFSTPTLKGFMGGFGRFLIIMLILQPILQKPVTKLFHKIFGKPETYLKNRGEGSNKKTKDKSKTPKTSDVKSKDIPQTSETNLLKLYGNQDIDTQSPSDVNAVQPLHPQKNSDEIAALNLFNKNKDNERTYIPSIKVDNSYAVKQDKELEKRVDKFIKEQDAKLKRTQKNAD